MVSKQKLVGLGLEFWCLTPLSTIFQLYSGSQKLTICLGDYMLFFRKDLHGLLVFISHFKQLFSAISWLPELLKENIPDEYNKMTSETSSLG